MGAPPTVLILSEATLLAIVGLVAIVVVALVVLAMVMVRPQAPATGAPAPVPLPAALPQPVPKGSLVRAQPSGRSVEIDVPTQHVDEFMNALRASGWRVHETGEVVATDEDEEGLTTVLVDMPQTTTRSASGEEIR